MKITKSIQDLSEIINLSLSDVYKSYEEATDYLNILKGKRESFFRNYQKDDNQRHYLKKIIKEERYFRYHIFVRTTFSYFEALTFTLKQLTFAVGKEFTDKEIIQLREEKFEGPLKNKVSSKIVKISLPDNVKFALKIASNKLAGSKVDVGGSDWENLIKAIEVRNRITHPQKPKDLMILKREIDIVYQAYNWYHKTILDIFSKWKNK